MLTCFWVLGLIPAALSITYKQNTVLVYEMLVVVLVAVDVCQLALWSFFNSAGMSPMLQVGKPPCH